MPLPEDWPTPEAMAAAQRLYEWSNAPVADIAILLGMQERHIYMNIRAWGWRHRRPRGGTAPARVVRQASQGTRPPNECEAAESIEVKRRLIQMLSQELADLETRKAEEGGDTTGAAAAIASLTRSAIQTHDLCEREARSDDNGGDTEPASPEELRDELARRLDRLRGTEEES
jgi:hypothetical protein